MPCGLAAGMIVLWTSHCSRTARSVQFLTESPHQTGCSGWCPVEDGVTRAAALAKQADVVILCLGNHPMQVARECYDRPDLELPAHQKNLLRAVQAANPNTVLTVVSSYPMLLGEARELLPAILYTTHAGPELATP